MATVKNVEGLNGDQKCEKCSYSKKIERGVYHCQKAASGQKVEISCNGKCLNHYKCQDGDYNRGTWH